MSRTVGTSTCGVMCRPHGTNVTFASSCVLAQNVGTFFPQVAYGDASDAS